jgi:L-fuconolactonase
VLDAHVHFWDPDARSYDWLDGLPALRRPFLPRDYDGGALVFVQAGCRDDEALDEAAWVAALAREDARIRGIVAHAPLELGAAAAPRLDALAAEPLVVGVRRLLQEAPELLEQPAFAAGLELLAERALPFDLALLPPALPAAERLAARCPRVTFVLDHCGNPDLAGGAAALDRWRADLRTLAARPNVVCKLSGLATRGGALEAARGCLEHAVSVFGAERCLAGSDWPLVTLATTRARWQELVADVAGEPAVLDATAQRVYRLGAEVAP